MRSYALIAAETAVVEAYTAFMEAGALWVVGKIDFDTFYATNEARCQAHDKLDAVVAAMGDDLVGDVCPLAMSADR